MGYAIKIRVKYRNNFTKIELQLPAVLAESGVVISHLRYLAVERSKSASWRERSVFSLLLLIRYIHASDSRFTKTTELLRSFSVALVEGTIHPLTLEDSSELFWSPRRLDDASAILSHITAYTDWLSEQEGYDSQRVNPFRNANHVEQRLNWCAYYHKKSRVFLNHLDGVNTSTQLLKMVREVRTPQALIVNTSDVKRFPASEIKRLLELGFVRPYSNVDTPIHERFDYKNQAITLLMHYGGVRISEALHIYLTDILIDPQRVEAIVRIHHPTHGESPSSLYSNRKEYLAKEFQLKPRTDYPKTLRLHLGWKAPLLTDRRGFFQVLFFPSEKSTEFLLIWRNYLAYQRVDPSLDNKHPYAFTNNSGHPETLKNFQRLHSAAVRRIGLEPEKYSGTTEHGHRHAYGYRLSENGFKQIEIQKAMHHKSPDSCLVYIQPSSEDIGKRMREVERHA